MSRKKRPYLLVGWLWYLGAAMPTIGIFQKGMQGYADRYTYLPTCGLLVMLVYTFSQGRWARNRRAMLAAGIGITVSAVVLAGFTYRQAGRWRDSVTLFEHTARVTPENSLVHLSLGAAYSRAQRYDDSIAHYRQVTDVGPNEPPPLINVAAVQLLKGDLAGAIATCKQSLEMGPETPEAYQALGIAYIRSDRTREAVEAFERALALRPENPVLKQQLQEAKNIAGK